LEEKLEGNKVSVLWIEGRYLQFLLYKPDEQGSRFSPGTSVKLTTKVTNDWNKLRAPETTRKKTTSEKASVCQVLEMTFLKSWCWEGISLSASNMYQSGDTPPNSEITSWDF